jgi:tungstate transport system substrate-binding protein
MMHRRTLLATAAAGTGALLAGCPDGDAAEAPGVADETLTLTTTTSTYDTGLLDEVNAEFDAEFGATVDAVAQGTGAALETARNGDADVVMVHARSLEDAFLRDGYGVNRRDLMFNDFVILGSASDPAGIDGLDSATEAFAAIADAEATFVSRGDNSGTHTKELAIWNAAGVAPGGRWYREAGSGMGEVLTQANETPAYTLSDRGTYLARRSNLDIGIRLQGPIVGGPAILANPYGIIASNPGRHENVNYDLAMAYIGFVTSPTGQRIIREYTVEGEQLFFPRAVSRDPNFQQYVPEGWEGTEE